MTGLEPAILRSNVSCLLHLRPHNPYIMLNIGLLKTETYGEIQPKLQDRRTSYDIISYDVYVKKRRIKWHHVTTSMTKFLQIIAQPGTNSQIVNATANVLFSHLDLFKLNANSIYLINNGTVDIQSQRRQCPFTE